MILEALKQHIQAELPRRWRAEWQLPAQHPSNVVPDHETHTRFSIRCIEHDLYYISVQLYDVTLSVDHVEPTSLPKHRRKRRYSRRYRHKPDIFQAYGATFDINEPTSMDKFTSFVLKLCYDFENYLGIVPDNQTPAAIKCAID